MYRPRKGDRVNAIQPAKALLVAAVVGLGLSGGFAAAAFLPGGSAPAGIAQVWDQTVGQVFANGLGAEGLVPYGGGCVHRDQRGAAPNRARYRQESRRRRR